MTALLGLWLAPLHAGVFATHWLGQLAVLALIAGGWLLLAGLIDRRRAASPPAAAGSAGAPPEAPSGRALIARPLSAPDAGKHPATTTRAPATMPVPAPTSSP